MRVLFTVFASKAHLFNLVTLGWALRAQGHEVCVASHPDLTETITRTGLTAVTVGDRLDMGGTAQAKGSSNQEVLSRGLSSPYEEQRAGGWDHALAEFTLACGVRYEYLADQKFTDDLVSFCDGWRPDLVIWDALTFAGAIAARSCGAAHARMLFGLDLINRLHDDYRALRAGLPPEAREDPLGEWFTGRLDRIGQTYHPGLERELVAGQWTIDPMPPWMRLPNELTTVPVRYVPYNGPTGVPDWLSRPPERPRICLTLGLSMREDVGDSTVSVTDLLGGFEGLDMEVIATLTADQVGSAAVPDNVTLVDFVPLNDLLPSCAGIVHQAGLGTHSNALVHGVPDIIVPDPFWDELERGLMAEKRGSAIVVPPGELTPERLRDAVVRIVAEPSYRAAALDIKRELMDVPSPRDVVPVLEELTAAHR
ncbi:activator-dependent family glycosyltransferase [Streptomyces sp. NPDC006798]|uniref:activator-dependent family glycosyltransferase n=1 Tax=Streptomyces sp. NPDC006798 TaxID=3155462 RepID=UPI0033FF8071